VVGRVVDRIDRGSLRIARSARQREVRVATALGENAQLVVDATPASIRTTIVERPVAVNEGPRYAVRDRIDRECAMTLAEHSHEAMKLLSQPIGRIVVVM